MHDGVLRIVIIITVIYGIHVNNKPLRGPRVTLSLLLFWILVFNQSLHMIYSNKPLTYISESGFFVLVSKFTFNVHHGAGSQQHTPPTQRIRRVVSVLSLNGRSSLSAMMFCLMMVCCGCVMLWLDRVMSKQCPCNLSLALFCLPRIHVLTVNDAHETSTFEFWFVCALATIVFFLLFFRHFLLMIH